MNRIYECVVIAKQDIPSQDIHKYAKKIHAMFTDLSCKLLKKEYWGLRNLAYEIKKNKKGHYFFMCIEGSGNSVKKVENNFKVSEEILKYFTVRTESVDESPTLMMQTPS